MNIQRHTWCLLACALCITPLFGMGGRARQEVAAQQVSATVNKIKQAESVSDAYDIAYQFLEDKQPKQRGIKERILKAITANKAMPGPQQEEASDFHKSLLGILKKNKYQVDTLPNSYIEWKKDQLKDQFENINQISDLYDQMKDFLQKNEPVLTLDQAKDLVTFDDPDKMANKYGLDEQSLRNLSKVFRAALDLYGIENLPESYADLLLVYKVNAVKDKGKQAKVYTAIRSVAEKLQKQDITGAYNSVKAYMTDGARKALQDAGLLEQGNVQEVLDGVARVLQYNGNDIQSLPNSFYVFNVILRLVEHDSLDDQGQVYDVLARNVKQMAGEIGVGNARNVVIQQLETALKKANILEKGQVEAVHDNIIAFLKGGDNIEDLPDNYSDLIETLKKDDEEEQEEEQEQEQEQEQKEDQEQKQEQEQKEEQKEEQKFDNVGDYYNSIKSQLSKASDLPDQADHIKQQILQDKNQVTFKESLLQALAAGVHAYAQQGKVADNYQSVLFVAGPAGMTKFDQNQLIYRNLRQGIAYLQQVDKADDVEKFVKENAKQSLQDVDLNKENVTQVLQEIVDFLGQDGKSPNDLPEKEKYGQLVNIAKLVKNAMVDYNILKRYLDDTADSAVTLNDTADSAVTLIQNINAKPGKQIYLFLKDVLKKVQGNLGQNIEPDDLESALQASELQKKPISIDDNSNIKGVYNNIVTYLNNQNVSVDNLPGEYNDEVVPGAKKPTKQVEEIKDPQNKFNQAQKDLNQQLQNAQDAIGNDKVDDAQNNIKNALNQLQTMFTLITQNEVNAEQHASAVCTGYNKILLEIHNLLDKTVSGTFFDQLGTSIKTALDATLRHQPKRDNILGSLWSFVTGDNAILEQVSYRPDFYEGVEFEKIDNAHIAYAYLLWFTQRLEKGVEPQTFDSDAYRKAFENQVLNNIDDFKPEFLKQAAQAFDKKLGTYLQNGLENITQNNNQQLASSETKPGSVISIMQAWHQKLYDKDNDLVSPEFHRNQYAVAYYFRNIKNMVPDSDKITSKQAQGILSVLQNKVKPLVEIEDKAGTMGETVKKLAKLDSLDDWVKTIINECVKEYNNAVTRGIPDDARDTVNNINMIINHISSKHSTDTAFQLPPAEKAEEKEEEAPDELSGPPQNVQNFDNIVNSNGLQRLKEIGGDELDKDQAHLGQFSQDKLKAWKEFFERQDVQNVATDDQKEDLATWAQNLSEALGEEVQE